MDKRKEREVKKRFEEKESDVKKEREEVNNKKLREEENRKQSVRSILFWCLVFFYLVVLGLGTR